MVAELVSALDNQLRLAFVDSKVKGLNPGGGVLYRVLIKKIIIQIMLLARARAWATRPLSLLAS